MRRTQAREPAPCFDPVEIRGLDGNNRPLFALAVLCGAQVIERKATSPSNVHRLHRTVAKLRDGGVGATTKSGDV